MFIITNRNGSVVCMGTNEERIKFNKAKAIQIALNYKFGKFGHINNIELELAVNLVDAPLGQYETGSTGKEWNVEPMLTGIGHRGIIIVGCHHEHARLSHTLDIAMATEPVGVVLPPFHNKADNEPFVISRRPIVKSSLTIKGFNKDKSTSFRRNGFNKNPKHKY